MNQKITLMAALTLFAFFAQAETASTSSLSKTSQATAQIGASDYVVVDFEQGRAGILPAHKDKLRELAAVAKAAGEKREIEVLAWADREYPQTGQKATSGDIKLAEERAKAIETYLEKDLSLSKVEPHNMAKRPNMFSELFKTDDFEMKKTFEQTGAAPAEADSGLSKFLMSKASKAVVIIKRN